MGLVVLLRININWNLCLSVPLTSRLFMRQGQCLQNINGAHCTETKRDGRVVNVQLHVVHLTDTEERHRKRHCQHDGFGKS